MKRFAFLVLAMTFAGAASAQDIPAGTGNRMEYPFILRDSPARLFTMRQFDEDALSGYRILADLARRNLDPVISAVVQAVFDIGFFKTLTHEEAHRSILVGEDIGAVSHPVLMGECNYSDAHLFPVEYEVRGIGQTLGMPVPGTGTFVWWESQIDPTLRFGIPQGGWRTPDGKLCENNQLEPDILVKNEPDVMSAGRDQQIEAAAKELLKKK